MKILIIHGPNLNLLGTREPDIYGSITLEEINNSLKETGQLLGVEVECFQSNHEGEIIDKIQGLSQNKCVTSRLSIHSSSKACDLRHSELCRKERGAAGGDKSTTECNNYFVTAPESVGGIFDALIINPGAYTHTSIAIADAISGIGIPTIEVHISNIHKREKFRQKSFISLVAIGQITGFGKNSYLLGLKAAVDMLRQ